jgi:hypothetical protein
MHKRPHSWCWGDQALCSVNVGNPTTCSRFSAPARANCPLRPSASPAQVRPADGQPRSSSGCSTGHAQAARSSRESERAPTGSNRGQAPHPQASSTPYRAAPERRRGAPAATLRCIRARRPVRAQSARSPPLMSRAWQDRLRVPMGQIVHSARPWLGGGPTKCVVVPIAKSGRVGEASSHAVRPTTPDAHAAAPPLPATRRRRFQLERRG